MQQVSNYRFKSILSWSTKSEFVSNEYFLPKKLSARHENISGSHKTVCSYHQNFVFYPQNFNSISMD